MPVVLNEKLRNKAFSETAYLESVKIPAGYIDTKEFRNNIQDFIGEMYGDKNLIQNISNDQIFFNYELLDKMKLETSELQQKLSAYILSQDKIHRVYTREQIVNGAYSHGMEALIKNGFNHKRSGDVIYIMEPSVISYPRKGSTTWQLIYL